MSEKLSASIEVGLDGSKVQEGVAPITRSIDGLARAAKRASGETAEGMRSIGDSGSAASEKIDRATNNMVSAIQRTTVAMEAGSKTSAKYFEVLAQQRGINVEVLKPYLDQLKAVEAAQKNVGISAAQTAAAMRSVPAQFTDIVTSLQGGQKPLTVLLQQGGQLKDMFGGVGNAARAMGSYIVGLINPLTVTAAAVGAVAYVYSQADDRAKEFSKSIIASGNAAGATAGQLNETAKQIANVGAGTQSQAAEALNALVSSGRVSMSIIGDVAKAAIRNQQLLGVSIEDTVKSYSDLAKDPVKTLETLNDKHHFLTIQLYEQVKALQDQGKGAEAAALAQSAYTDSLTAQADKVSKTLSDWERGWIRIKNAVSGAYDSTKSFFAASTVQSELKDLLAERDKLEAAQQRLANDNSFINQGAAARVQKLLDQNKALINLARDKIANDERAAKAEEEKNKQVEAGIKWAGIVEKNMTKQQKLELEIAKARNIGLAAGKSQAEIEKEVATIRENGAEKAKKATEDQSLAWQVSKADAKAWGKAQKEIYDDLIKSNSAFSDSVKKNTKDLLDGFNQQLQAENRLKASLDDWARGYQESADLAQLELSLLGQSSVQRNTVIAQYKIELELQKQIAAIERERATNKISDAGANEAILKAQQIAADAKNLASIKAQQEEWSKFYADIYNGLSDSLYRGFEAGKGFFQNFWDSVKNLFKTTVLKLAIQGVVGGVMGSLAGNSAAAGINSGANTLSSLSTMYSAGKSLWDGFSAAGTVGGGVVALGNAIGSSTISAFGTGMSMSSSAASAAAAAYSEAGMASTGSALTAGSSFGAAVPIIGWIMAGMAANNSLYDKGWKYNTGADDKTKAAGLLAGGLPLMGGLLQKAFGVSDKTASMLTGSAVLTRLFGRQEAKLQQSDFSGSFSDAGFSGTTRNVFKEAGGLFRSDKWSETKTAIGADQTKALSDTFSAIKAAAAGYATQLGLSAEAISGFSKTFSVNLSITGDAAKDAEANKKILDGIVTGLADDLSSVLMPSIKEFSKEGETASVTFARIATDFSGVNKLFGDLGLKLFSFGDAGIKASEAFLGLFGGLEQLNTVGAAYYENFYTEQERASSTVKALSDEFAKLSIGVLPSTRDQYRALVEQISKTGTPEQLAAVLKMSSAFASVVPVGESLSDVLAGVTGAAKSAADALAERARLQDEYDSLTMSSSDLLAKQRAALDESNRSLFDSIQAIKARKEAEDQAAQAAAEAAQRAQERAKSIASERESLQSELNSLTLTEAQLLALQREKLDESNRSLFDSINAIKAKQAADSEAARVAQEAAQQIQIAAEKAAQEAAARASEIANERAGLQDQLNQLTLSNSQLLELQREKLDASNRALFDQVQAERARQAAVAESTLAAEKAAQAEKEAMDKRDQELKAQYQKWIGELTSAFNRESSVFKDSIDQFTRLGDALNTYNDNLQTRSQSLLSPEAVYNASKAQFDTVASLARKGDQKALQQFQTVADAFLEASAKYNASGEAYFADLENVKKASKDGAIAAFANVDVAKLQLTLLERQVSGIIAVNESVLTVAQLLASGSTGYGKNVDGFSVNGSFGADSVGIAKDILDSLRIAGGFDQVYANAKNGDGYSRGVLSEQLIRWSQWGVKQAELDRLLGVGALKKVEDLFNVTDLMYSSDRLTRWDGVRQVPNFSVQAIVQQNEKTEKLMEEQNGLIRELLSKTQQGNATNNTLLGDVKRSLTNIESSGALEAAKA